MTRRFRLAIVGAGLITQGSHLPTALSSDRVEVVALIDPVVERAASLARTYGISPRIAPTIDSVLAEIDGALIATPNDRHAAVAIQCLEAGVAVLIEKPLASTALEARSIVTAAEASGITAAVGYSTRFRASTVLLKELVDRNHFGRPRRFVHQFGTPGGWSPLSAYNLTRSTAGGGVLIVTATHFIDRMLDLFGVPADVAFEDDSAGGPEANCTARFRYGTPHAGLEGIARYSKTTRLPSGMVIEFEQGTVTLADSDDAEIQFKANDGDYVQVIRRGRSAAPVGNSFLRQLEDFVDACRDGRPPRVSAQQGLLSLELIERLYASRRRFDENWYAGTRAAPAVRAMVETEAA